MANWIDANRAADREQRRGGRRGGEGEVLSWTTEAGRRFRKRMCGRVSAGEVEALARALKPQAGMLGERLRGKWSGGVLEIPHGITE